LLGPCSGEDPTNQSSDIVIRHTMVRSGYNLALRGFHAIIFFAQKSRLQNVVSGHETVKT
jgi:hypothetical protein